MLGNAYRRAAFYRRVIVNLDDGTAIEGLFWHQRGPIVMLKQAQLLRAGEQPIPLDGDQIIERARVLFIQAM